MTLTLQLHPDFWIGPGDRGMTVTYKEAIEPCPLWLIIQVHDCIKNLNVW